MFLGKILSAWARAGVLTSKYYLNPAVLVITKRNFYPKSENLIDLCLTYVNEKGGFDDKLPLPTYLRNNVAHKSLK